MGLRVSNRLVRSTSLTARHHREIVPRDTAGLFGRNWHDSLPSNDRREFRRMQVSWQSTIIEGDEEFPAIVTDISLGGAKAKTSASFSSNEEVLLDIHGITKLVARQIWEANGEIGLQFLASPSMVSEKLPSPYADLL